MNRTKRTFPCLLALSALVVASSGCWVSTTQIEPIADQHVRFDVGPRRADLRTTEVSVREDAGKLELIILRQEMCETREVRSSRQKKHISVKASRARWIPVSVLGAFGAEQAFAAAVHHDDDEDLSGTIVGSTVLIGAAFAIAAIPALAEREHERVGPPTYRSVPARPRPCGQTPWPNARVLLRTTVGTRVGATDASGSVVFQGLSFAQVRTIFVENIAVQP